MKENDNILIAQQNKTKQNKINESELFKKYKSSYKSAFLDLFIHTFFLSCLFYLLWIFRNSWFSVFTIPLLGLLNVKTFIIFHDCGHQSYTPSKTLNYIIGIIAGIIAFTPLSWNIRHDTHHVTNCNYKNKYEWRFNEHIYFTKQQYKKLNYSTRNFVKFFITPKIFYLFLPLVNFILLERFSVSKIFLRKTHKNSNKLFWVLEQVVNNIGVFIFVCNLFKYHVLTHFLISVWLSSNIGVILFHNQHTFNPPYVVNNETWNMKDSGLKGSSFIQIPYLLKYFTGNIEYHHVHHMNAKIPNYNLQSYHDEVTSKSDMFDNIVKLSMSDCYNNLWLVLYDEDKNKYITFKEADEEIRKNKLK
jgi:omega-6 fatty acid desaturase (delta-12 desaturase)